MKKLFYVILAVAVIGCGGLMAGEEPGFELRTRNSIGRLGLVKVPLSVKTQAGGTVTVSFQAPEAATYVLSYTTGPKKGKVATTVRAEKPGPVTAKIKNASN